MAYKNIEDARAASKRNYYEKKEVYLAKNRRRTEFFKNYITQLKESTPCTDCGKFYAACVMDFDHLRDKTFTISRLSKIGSLERLKIEIEKCEIVCANCHRLRTYKRKQHTPVAQ